MSELQNSSALSQSPAVQAGGFDPGMFPPAHRRRFSQLLIDHNPCLLLSTVLMLLGCYLLNSAIDVHAADSLGGHAKLISLLAVINLYELCIIPLGLLLIRRTHGTARDGLWLLLFEALFLVNGTFINVEPSPHWGWLVNWILLVLALLKTAFIFRGLKLPLRSRSFLFVSGQLVIIYLLPIILTLVSVDGVVPQRFMYGLYWLVGLLPVGYDILARLRSAQPRYDLAQQVIRRTYLILPWLLLVAHLGFSHWAHHSDFALADVGPLFFGLTIATQRVRLPILLQVWSRMLPVVGLLVSLNAPAALSFAPLSVLPLLTPALLATMATLLTYSYLLSLYALLGMMIVLTLAGLAYVLHDWLLAALRVAGRAFQSLVSSAATLGNTAWSFVPSTPASWGIVTVIAAFALLALGSYLSLRRTHVIRDS